MTRLARAAREGLQAAIKEFRSPRDIEESEALNKLLDSFVEAATLANQDWEQIYADGVNYLWNNQLAGKTRKEGWEAIQINKINPAVMQEIALQSQVNREIIVQPQGSEDVPAAKVWRDALQWDYEKGVDVPALIQKVNLDGKSYGHWVVKLWWDDEAEWDEEKNQWRGDLKYTVIRPEFLGVDPTAEDFDDAEYIWLLRQMSTDMAIAKYAKGPDAMAIKEAIITAANREQDHNLYGTVASPTPEMETLVESDQDAEYGDRDGATRLPDRQGDLAALLGKIRRPADVTAEDGTERPMKVTVLDILFRDPTMQTQQEDMEGGAEFDVPLYPWGRHVIRVNDKTILVDEPWDKPKWPYVSGKNISLPHTWHGLNASELAKGAQDWLNISMSHQLNWQKYFGDPEAKIEEGALAKDRDLGDSAKFLAPKAGKIIELAQGKIDAYQRIPPPPAPDTKVFQTLNDYLQDVMGMHDMGLGKTSAGQQTATEIINLQTNTRLRTALQDDNMKRFIEALMRRIHMFRKHYWQDGDTIRVIGQKTLTQPLEEAPPQEGEEDEEDPGAVAADAQEMIDETATLFTAEMASSKFDLKIEAVTTLPYDREKKIQEAQAVFGMVPTAIVLRKLLEALGWDEAEEIVQEWYSAQVAQAEADAQAMEAQANGQPGTPATGQTAQSPAKKP